MANIYVDGYFTTQRIDINIKSIKQTQNIHISILIIIAWVSSYSVFSVFWVEEGYLCLASAAHHHQTISHKLNGDVFDIICSIVKLIGYWCCVHIWVIPCVSVRIREREREWVWERVVCRQNGKFSEYKTTVHCWFDSWFWGIVDSMYAWGLKAEKTNNY